MEGKLTTNGVAPDDGLGALPRQILWQEVRILGYVKKVSYTFKMSR